MMKRINVNFFLMIAFAAIVGGLIGGLAWLYLRVANLGITVIWDMIPKYISAKNYTIIMCIVGGAIIGVFHKLFGPYPMNMKEAIEYVTKEKNFPYKNLHLVIGGAFLSIFFGGAVGPEAGLVSILLALVFWAIDQFGYARWRMEATLRNDPFIAKGLLFKTMLQSIITPADQLLYDKKQKWEKKEAVLSGVVAGVAGLIAYELLNAFLGRSLAIPHLDGETVIFKDKIIALLMIAIGIGAGYLYLFFKKVSSYFFKEVMKPKLIVWNSIIGGVMLGLIGSILPMTMFSGGNDIQAIQYEYMKYTPYLLILVGIVKLFLTNVCIESGWRGGHIFPVLFSGLSIAYGFAEILNVNKLLCVVLVSASLMATVMKGPFGALALSIIFFPLKNLGWMILASFAGGLIPVPKPFRENEDDKGFVFKMINMRNSNAFKALPQKDK